MDRAASPSLLARSVLELRHLARSGVRIIGLIGTYRLNSNIHNRRRDMWLLWTIVIGILAGFLAGKIVRGHGMGTLMDLLVGIVGSVLGGWIFTLLGLAAYGLIGQLVMATVGAVVLLVIVRAIKKT